MLLDINLFHSPKHYFIKHHYFANKVQHVNACDIFFFNMSTDLYYNTKIQFPIIIIFVSYLKWLFLKLKKIFIVI